MSGDVNVAEYTKLLFEEDKVGAEEPWWLGFLLTSLKAVGWLAADFFGEVNRLSGRMWSRSNPCLTVKK